MKTLRRFLILIVLLFLASQLAFAQGISPAQARSIGDASSQSALNRPRDSSDDVYWDNRFAPQGVNGPVNAIAVNGNDVYVGGNFTTAGGVVVNSIAKWDGSNWSALGTGIFTSYGFAGTVYSIAISGNNVYVGGMFSLAGGTSANNIAKWNGNSWSALSSGTDGSVYALAANGTDVYVGGYFYSAGGVAVNSIAKWNGSTWSALGSGVSAPANIAPTPSASELLKPIPFTAPTPVPTPATPPPPPGKGIVNAIAVNGNDVYIGGNFMSVGGVAVSGIAKWNGSVWSTLGSGVGGVDTRYPSVSAVAVSANNVYVGGGFSNAGGITTSGIAKWDGASWSSLGNGIGGGSNPQVKTIAINGTDVYVGGGFSAAGSVLASNVAQWDGNNWSALGSGGDSSVYAIAASASGVYVGGYFAKAGSNAASDIALWNGSTWSPLAAPLQPSATSARTISPNGMAPTGRH